MNKQNKTKNRLRRTWLTKYCSIFSSYGQNLKIIHFIGAAKPWLQHFNWESRAVDAPEHLRQFLQLWWDLFVADVHAQLDVSMVSLH